MQKAFAAPLVEAPRSAGRPLTLLHAISERKPEGGRPPTLLQAISDLKMECSKGSKGRLGLCASRLEAIALTSSALNSLNAEPVSPVSCVSDQSATTRLSDLEFLSNTVHINGEVCYEER
mmetsp:Transcript_37105/g.106596  ORF Transcript_37105/g.106596 Transcript_37105/m.106596 type:complete len:120 (+) Transcript_37105:103-462(+)